MLKSLSLSLISCSFDCTILLSVAIRGQLFGPAGRPITGTVLPLIRVAVSCRCDSAVKTVTRLRSFG
jgi:hypothetical protein